MKTRDQWNGCRFDPSDERGHYESYFQRANHPERPLAFWIRYTLFSPKGRCRDAVGELWAIFFDGEAGTIHAVKEALPMQRCAFSPARLEARIGEATLDGSRLSGAASTGADRLSWTLAYTGGGEPLLLLPESLYAGPFPKAKALVGTPNARYSGELSVNGRTVAVEDWVGSQNHNWGSKHTDRYAWGQVAGFDGVPDSFFECATAQLKVGPLWSPRMTVMVLRLEGREYRLNAIPQALRAHGRWDLFTWEFESRTSEVHLSGQFSAPSQAFVGLPYDNPPGGRKTCLNSKLAHCRLTVRAAGHTPRTLTSAHRAAFELITDARHHGVPMLAV